MSTSHLSDFLRFSGPHNLKRENYDSASLLLPPKKNSQANKHDMPTTTAPSCCLAGLGTCLGDPTAVDCTLVECRLQGCGGRTGIMK